MLSGSPARRSGPDSGTGPYADRIRAQVAQDAGDPLLGGAARSDERRPSAQKPHYPRWRPQVQAGAGPVQDVPQQRGALDSTAWCWPGVRPGAGFQGFQIQEPLALLGSDLLSSGLQQSRRLSSVVDRAQVLHDPAHTICPRP